MSVIGINSDLYRRRLADRAPIQLITGPSGICEGCPVMFTENDWSRGLNNGSIGKIVEAFLEPKILPDAEDSASRVAVCRAIFDGEEQLLSHSDFLSQRVVRAFSITVHKAQGSQWNRVIVPVERSTLLDRTLVYTALTRAVRQVVFVGDLDAAAAAVIAPPRALNRIVGLRL
jgi:exodeoxyribonuclease V alpha subunit